MIVFETVRDEGWKSSNLRSIAASICTYGHFVSRIEKYINGQHKRGNNEMFLAEAQNI